jgi:hypothetical protein
MDFILIQVLLEDEYTRIRTIRTHGRQIYIFRDKLSCGHAFSKQSQTNKARLCARAFV